MDLMDIAMAGAMDGDIRDYVDKQIERLRNEFLEYVKQETDTRVALEKKVRDLEAQLNRVDAIARSADVRTRPIGL